MLFNDPDPAVAQPGAETCRSAAEDWAAESGLAMPEFQRIYFEQCVAGLEDQYPAVRHVDAERLALNETSWLEDRAA